MKIEFGSRWISNGGCNAQVIEADEKTVGYRWEGTFDECHACTRQNFLEKFREYTEPVSDASPIQIGSMWWHREENGGLIRGVVVGIMDGMALVHTSDGEEVSASPAYDFEGYADEFFWHIGSPNDISPRAEMEAKMAAIQAELDELKRLLGQ